MASMSAAEHVVDSDSFAKQDGLLFILTSMFVLCLPALRYVSLHNNYAALTIAGGFLLVLVYGYVAIIVLIRIIRLRILKSPVLLACVGMLAMLPFIVTIVSYAIDQFRFQNYKNFYVAEVKKSETSPKFAVFDWGESGFLGTSNSYFLVFDENSSMENGSRDPTDLLVRDDTASKCRHSMYRISGHFYSVEIMC